MEKQLKENKRSPRKRIVNFLVHVLLAVLALIWVMPIVWIVLTSFRAEPGAYTNTYRSCCLCRIRSAGCVSNSVNRI